MIHCDAPLLLPVMVPSDLLVKEARIASDTPLCFKIDRQGHKRLQKNGM